MNMPVNIADGLESITASLGTARDKASSVVYAESYVNDEELTAAYKTSWLARKIIDVPATDIFRRWRNWQAEEDQIEKLEDLEKKLGLKEKFTRAKKLARLYGCCYVYYDLGDDQMQPVDLSKVKASGIRFVTVLTHRQLSPGEIEQDALSDQFGKPKWFDVVSTTSGNVRIDPSRVIVFLGSESPDDNLLVGTREGHGSRLGTSVLLATLPAVKHFDSVATNIASLVFEAKIDVIKVKGLMQIAGNPYEEAKLLARYALAAVAKGNNGMLILDGEMEEYEQKSYSFAALPDIMDRFSQNASGAADVPMTRLFGNSPGGLNSTGEGDLRHYYDHLSSIQELQITPALEMFDECLIRAALGSRPPEVYYLWASLWQMSDKERSDLGSTGVNTIKTLKDTGLIPDEVLSRGAVNMLTQAGVIPGLEAEYTAYFDGGGEAPWDIEADTEAEAAAAKVQPKKPQPGKPGTLTDEQARAPKGSNIGGQWVKTNHSITNRKVGLGTSVVTTEDTGTDDPEALLEEAHTAAFYVLAKGHAVRLAALKTPDEIAAEEVQQAKYKVNRAKKLEREEIYLAVRSIELDHLPVEELFQKHKDGEVTRGDVIRSLQNRSRQDLIALRAEYAARNDPIENAVDEFTAQGDFYSLSSALLLTPPPPTAFTQNQDDVALNINNVRTESQRSALEGYGEYDYKKINAALRSGMTHPSVRPMDAAFGTAESKQDMVVVRVITEAGMKTIEAQIGARVKPGDVIQDLGYMSTTRLPHVAAAFAGGNGYGIKIKIPEGFPLIGMVNSENRATEHEDEFLLPRNTSLRVTGVQGRIVMAEVVTK